MKTHELERWSCLPGWFEAARFMAQSRISPEGSGWMLAIDYPQATGQRSLEYLLTQKGEIRIFKNIETLTGILLRCSPFNQVNLKIIGVQNAKP